MVLVLRSMASSTTSSVGSSAMSTPVICCAGFPIIRPTLSHFSAVSRGAIVSKNVRNSLSFSECAIFSGSPLKSPCCPFQFLLQGPQRLIPLSSLFSRQLPAGNKKKVQSWRVCTFFINLFSGRGMLPPESFWGLLCIFSRTLPRYSAFLVSF